MLTPDQVQKTYDRIVHLHFQGKPSEIMLHNELLRTGPRLLVQMMNEGLDKQLHCEGLVDTGADITSFEEEAILALGYTAHSRVNIQTATGKEQRGLYWVNMRIPQTHGPAKIVTLEVAGLGNFNKGTMPFGLLGRDLLYQGTFRYDGPSGEFVLELSNTKPEQAA